MMVVVVLREEEKEKSIFWVIMLEYVKTVFNIFKVQYV